MMLFRRKKINRRILLILFLGTIAVLLFAIPASAQDGRDILLRTSENMMSIEAWWDQLWESTFDPPVISTTAVGDTGGIENPTNLSVYAFVNPVRFLLAIGLTFWLFNFGKKMYESKGAVMGVQVFFQLFLPVFLSILFLSNQASYSRVLAYGLRDVINSWSDGILDLEIVDVNVRSAVQDMLVTEDAKETIVQKMQTCQAMPQPEVTIPSAERPGSNGEEDALPLTTEQRQVYDYLECLEELSNFAQTQLNQADAARGCNNSACKALGKLYEVTSNAVADANRKALEGRLSLGVDYPIPDLGLSGGELLSILTQPGKEFLNFTQWMSISSLEMALFLMGLFAPMFIAASLIPNRQNLFSTWLIGTITIGLAKFAYIVIIGVVAVQQVSSENLSSLDNTFFMTLGIFAPAVSFAVATVGGIAAASSYRNQSVGAVSVVGSVASSTFSTIAYSLYRNSDKNR